MLSRIKVSHKLLLIYALDMIAVIFLGFSLAEEKFLSINFARRELVGIDYIAHAREALFVALAPERTPGQVEEQVRGLREAETRLGAGMETAALVEAAVEPLRALDRGETTAPAIAALHRVIGRIGDMSNLILDPDLDSYYTMSLVVLRFPDLVETLSRLRQESADSAGADPGGHAALAVLQGQLSAISKGIEDDLAAGIRGNPDGSLKQALSDRFAPLTAALVRLNAAMAPEVIVDGLSAPERTQLTGAVDATLAEAERSWTAAATELNRLIGLRIDGFFLRMYEHFALAGILLTVILTLVV